MASCERTINNSVSHSMTDIQLNNYNAYLRTLLPSSKPIVQRGQVTATQHSRRGLVTKRGAMVTHDKAVEYEDNTNILRRNQSSNRSGSNQNRLDNREHFSNFHKLISRDNSQSSSDDD